MPIRLTAIAHLANELGRMTLDLGGVVAATRPGRNRHGYYEDHF